MMRGSASPPGGASRGGGGPDRIAAIVPAALGLANARRPLAISYRTQPRLKMSVRGSSGSPFSCSGDMYAVVPGMVPGSVSAATVSRSSRRSSSTALASPKSSTFTRPRADSMMFCGLMSRWMMPRACASPSASATSEPMRSSSSAATGPRAIRVASVSPSMYCIAK